MGRKLSVQDFPQLLSWLHGYLPETFMLCEKLTNHMKGSSPYLDFHVDQWPDPQAVIVISKNDGQLEQVYGTSEEAALSLLGDDVVDWTKDNFHYWPLPDKLGCVVKALALHKNRKAVYDSGYMFKATHQDLKLIPVPEGMKISAVSEEDGSILGRTWKGMSAGFAMYVRNQVKYYASVMLTTESGEHVGHMIGKDCGTIGMLYVQPQFRGNGYAKLIVSQLAQKYFDQGKDVYVAIRARNVVSFKLHLSIGFKCITDLKIGWLAYYDTVK